MATSAATKLASSSAASMKLLSSWFPHAKSPLIVGAPMRVISGPELACAVTAAGGLGFLGAGWEYPSLSADFSTSRKILNTPPGSPLPIGVGFLTADAPIEDALPAIIQHKPIAVWLSFPREPEQHRKWISALKTPGKEWGLKIMVQVCNVSDALEAANMGADAIVVQGSDAGGHGRARSAGLVSLLPEVKRALLRSSSSSDIPLLAAGGIVNGTGAAAALALGAHGVVMGTRFVASDESLAAAGYKSAIVGASDGGISTLRTNVFDKLRGAIQHWPDMYNGRGIVNESIKDHEGGLPEDENKAKYKEAEGRDGFERLTVFAGTGVGMVDKVIPAGDIVKETREEIKAVLEAASSIVAVIAD